MELFIVLIVILVMVGVIFNKEVLTGVVSLKSLVNKRAKVSVKIRVVISEIDGKIEKLKQVYHEVNTYVTKMKQAHDKEVDSAVRHGEVTGVLLRDQFKRGEKVKVGTKVRVTSIETYYSTVKYHCNTMEGDYIEIRSDEVDLNEGDSKHLARCANLKKVIETYDAKSEKIKSAIDDLKNKKVTLRDDAEYVETMESLKSISTFGDINFDADINNIMAEIAATEKDLELGDI
jgi:prefoldin subunit 5